ncbi:MAG: RNA methyltransferase [Desulfobacterales bacterium]|nr:RNA methyltransferase [Desulfobacterales bacterium]
MMEKINLDNIAIVLQQPRYPENIGSAARAVSNMGISRLYVVNPENYDPTRINTLATHAAAAVVESIRTFTDLKSALAEFNYVVGTTARLGGQRPVLNSPEVMATKLVPLSRENQIAVLFGPEDRGLTNEDLRLCHQLVHIPTAEFSSINLAQSVMILSYELFKASLKQVDVFAPRLATRHELDGMYDQVKDILVRINYINPENPDYWMNKIRRFLSRVQLRAREVSIVRGICRQVDWYAGKKYKDGVQAGPWQDQETEKLPCD